MIGIGSRYLDARGGPAEGSPIQGSPVSVIADAYPIKQPGELVWVKVCLRTLERLERPAGGAAVIDTSTNAIARRYWVRDQLALSMQAVSHCK